MLSSEDQSSVVSDGKDDVYKLFGVAGSNSSSSNICKKPQQNIFATSSRQHHSSGIHQQLGWDDFQAVSWSSKVPMDVVSGRNIHITAQHLPGKLNYLADTESRVMMDRSDWKMNPITFQKMFGPLEVDLFASRLTTQLQTFFNWRPDPYAVATDSFLQDWTTRKGYANPPWCMIGRTLSQVKSQLAQIVLVTPVWKPQPWYLVLLNMVIDCPRLILDNPVVVNQHCPGMFPQLAVWLVSGRDILAKNFRRMLQHSCLNQGDQKPASLTTHSLGDGVAGVVRGVPIPFLDL